MTALIHGSLYYHIYGIYNLIVEKLSESDNIYRKKSSDLSFEEKSKKKFEHNDININYHLDNIKIQNNKDNTHVKSALKIMKRKKYT